MNDPAVTIVIPNFNKEAFLPASIASVLAQGPVAEAIFVDDASTDRSIELLSEAAEKHDRIRLIRAPGKLGGSACRNIGLAAARGDFIIFLDSDDVLESTCCISRLAAAKSQPHNDLWVFPMSVFRDRIEQPLDRWVPREGEHLRHFLAHRLDWHTMQPLWRRSFAERIGGFDPSFPRLQDPEIHTKALLNGCRVALFPGSDPDCHYRVTAERHDADATGLAERHVEGTILYCDTFAPRISKELTPMLSGTILACQSMILQWWRAGRLSSRDASRFNERVLRACMVQRHARVLRAFFAAQRSSPVHVPGLKQSVKLLLGLP